MFNSLRTSVLICTNGAERSEGGRISSVTIKEKFMVTLNQTAEAIPAAVNFRQAAEILQMSPNTLRKLYERGDVRTMRIVGTRQRLISKDEILRLLAEAHDQPEQDYPTCSGTTTTGAPCHRRRAVISNNTSALYCNLHMQEQEQGQIIERSLTT